MRSRPKVRFGVDSRRAKLNGIARPSLRKAADIEAERTKNLVQNLSALFTFEHSIAKSNILQAENSLLLGI
jgi:hypothetical protein